MGVQLLLRVLCLVLLSFSAIELRPVHAQAGGDQPIDKLDPLLVSDGSHFKPKDYYPNFSWDTTPMYFMFGDTQRLLLPEEVKSIAARTDFLCIGKAHGRQAIPAAELTTKHEVAAFRKIKPEAKVLFYFNSAYAWPFTSYNAAFTRKKIGDHPELKKFLIVDAETGELVHRNNVLCFDVLNADFRDWWVDTVAKGVAESGSNGAFIDQMHGFSWLRKERSHEVQQAMGEMMEALKKKMRPDKILLGNNAHQPNAKHVFPVVDASMFEHFNEKLISKESLLRDWQDMLKIAKAGKISIFRIGVDVEADVEKKKLKYNDPAEMAALANERLQYYLACYLIGAQPYSYFQYGWGWRLDSGNLHDFPMLHKPLGPPKGAYQRTTPDRWQFTREFEHASVWVDLETKEAKIEWAKPSTE